MELVIKILVSVKRVVDYRVNVRVKPDESGVDLANVKMSMNPFDEIAVEEAVRLKEKGIATEVITAIAMGADKGIQVLTDAEIQPLAAAKIFKKLVEKEQVQIVILGKQAIDDDSSQTGQMLASLLNWGQATFASKVEVKDGKAFVTREIDGGLQTVAVKLPAVITTDLRLNEPRYVKLPDIMKARSKPLDKINVADLGIDVAPRTQTLKMQAPKKRSAGIKVKTVDDLIAALKQKQII
jgi:electron transfer flavoprotein beta subunit